MERDRLVKELKYREEQLPKDQRDVERCVASVRETFDFCKGEYTRAMAEKQVGDVLPIPEERGYKRATLSASSG